MIFHIRAAAAVAAVFCLAAHALPGAAQEGRPPLAVTVETLGAETVTLSSTLPGRVHASAEAEVRPQVNGIVVERLFDEGSAVAAGDVLYRIDPGTYEAGVSQARASVRQAKAQLRAADREADRIETLQERGISSMASQDDAVSARDAAAAGLEVAQAQLDLAQLELDRTGIRARLSGVIGFSQASAGALVTASQASPLAVIRTLDPVYVDVTQSASKLLEWRRRMMGGGVGPSREVELTLADGSIYDHVGELTAAEPHVDEQTGVVVLRVEFDNPDGLLLPGMYVQVEMPTGTIANAVLAPQEAVGRDRRGAPTALVVNADGVVEQRALTILQDLGSDWVVTEGLGAGDRIIVAGGQKVAPGDTVTAEERADPEATAATAPQNETADAAGIAARGPAAE